MNKAAQQLGRLGGMVASEAKKKAARKNWKKAVAAIKRKAANAPAHRPEREQPKT